MCQQSLELVATDDLLDELLHRFDHAVFGGLQAKHADEQLITRRWFGSHFTCVGLAQSVAWVAMVECEEESVDEPDGD